MSDHSVTATGGERLSHGGAVSIHPWRIIAIGGEFFVPKPTKFVSRDAATYRKKYQLVFACRKAPGGTIVRRIA